MDHEISNSRPETGMTSAALAAVLAPAVEAGVRAAIAPTLERLVVQLERLADRLDRLDALQARGSAVVEMAESAAATAPPAAAPVIPVARVAPVAPVESVAPVAPVAPDEPAAPPLPPSLAMDESGEFVFDELADIVAPFSSEDAAATATPLPADVLEPDAAPESDLVLHEALPEESLAGETEQELVHELEDLSPPEDIPLLFPADASETAAETADEELFAAEALPLAFQDEAMQDEDFSDEDAQAGDTQTGDAAATLETIDTVEFVDDAEVDIADVDVAQTMPQSFEHASARDLDEFLPDMAQTETPEVSEVSPVAVQFEPLPPLEDLEQIEETYLVVEEVLSPDLPDLPDLLDQPASPVEDVAVPAPKDDMQATTIFAGEITELFPDLEDSIEMEEPATEPGTVEPQAATAAEQAEAVQDEMPDAEMEGFSLEAAASTSEAAEDEPWDFILPGESSEGAAAASTLELADPQPPGRTVETWAFDLPGLDTTNTAVPWSFDLPPLDDVSQAATGDTAGEAGEPLAAVDNMAETMNPEETAKDVPDLEGGPAPEAIVVPILAAAATPLMHPVAPPAVPAAGSPAAAEKPLIVLGDAEDGDTERTSIEFNEYNEPVEPPRTPKETRRVIWYMHKRGCPSTQIADYLTLERVPSFSGRASWDMRDVDAVIKKIAARLQIRKQQLHRQQASGAMNELIG
ncbi:hypothetical protein [Megalodesulfovibrio gigas]|uniref:Uncharacterized protein n=1 Tax=Megalodesulfovibrio gigas (strain ATCC 19364 / DSM 1382 / NCIMB 9332 / VKM B-1759) TaxID=1121448 RepID=T2G6G0_MEGG1|nr:hypothetical protein [Megalodesulfovibrio gigas]AGW12155.1 hypothetical protein DGI_0221 [Megalodesulfovibrio gigas DSM 1382 = ATCC 19364]